jgi:peptidoglycan DL-endopeptidase LytE
MRHLSTLLFTALLMLLLISTPAQAGSIRTVLDGRELAFDVPPRLENGRMLVPLRGILAPLGAEFTWNEGDRTVRAFLGETAIEMVLDARTASVNGQAVELDTPARSVDGRTLVPLRFFAEALGFRVAWDEAGRTVAIGSRGGALVARGTGSDRSDGEGTPDGAPERPATGARMVAVARRLVGSPYSWGGTGPDSFDCSGFVLFVASQFGADLPRTSFAMFSAGTPVSRADLKPGDLVFFTTYAAGASHVGFYAGDGTFIHAASETRGVTVTRMDNVWWAPRYLGARRITD